MQNIVQPGIEACLNCSNALFKYSVLSGQVLLYNTPHAVACTTAVSDTGRSLTLVSGVLCLISCFAPYCSHTHTDCANDIRSFLNFESRLTSKIDVSLPSQCPICPLAPWQYALIALASLHVFCFIVNVLVPTPVERACIIYLSPSFMHLPRFFVGAQRSQPDVAASHFL
jgi:hypothetical protein